MAIPAFDIQQNPIALFFSAWCPGGLAKQNAFLNLLFSIPSIALIVEPAASKTAFLLPGDTTVSPSKNLRPFCGKEFFKLSDEIKTF